MTDLRITGADQLAAVGRDLKLAGSETVGLRRSLLKNLRAAAKPVQDEVKRNAFAIPATGMKSTGLRTALMRATHTTVSMSVKGATVKVVTDSKRMPPGQTGMAENMEGPKPFRHPVYGNRAVWVTQQSHPYSAPAANTAENAATIAAVAAVEETAARIELGNL